MAVLHLIRKARQQLHLLTSSNPGLKISTQYSGSRIQDPGSRISIRIQEGETVVGGRRPLRPRGHASRVNQGRCQLPLQGRIGVILPIVYEHNRHNRMYHISSNKKGCHRLNSTKDFRQAWALGTSTWPRSKNDHQAHHHTQSNPKMSLFHLQSRRVWGLVIRSWRGAASYSGCKEKQQYSES